jgi:hypothetical protein
MRRPPATASVSDGTDASVNAGSGYQMPGAGFASVQFDLTETWTVLGGTGSGLIYVENLPPFITASAMADILYSDDDVVISGPPGFHIEDSNSGLESSLAACPSRSEYRFRLTYPSTFTQPLSWMEAKPVSATVRHQERTRSRT